MPAIPQKVLLYLISKPDTWRLKLHDIRKQLGLIAYAGKRRFGFGTIGSSMILAILLVGFVVYASRVERRLSQGPTA